MKNTRISELGKKKATKVLSVLVVMIFMISATFVLFSNSEGDGFYGDEGYSITYDLGPEVYKVSYLGVKDERDH